LVDVIKGAVTLAKADEKTGTVFTLIVNVAEVVVTWSGRVPITLMV
jgi:hypothetical protein